jgi:hypothetical protein
MRPIIYHNQPTENDEDSLTTLENIHINALSTVAPRQTRLQILGLLRPNQSRKVFLARSEFIDSQETLNQFVQNQPHAQGNQSNPEEEVETVFEKLE